MKPIHSYLAATGLAALSLAAASCHRTADSGTSFDLSVRTDTIANLIPDFYGDSVYSLSAYSVIWPDRIGHADLTELHDSLLSVIFNQPRSSFNDAARQWNETNMQNADTDTTFSSVAVPQTEALDADKMNFASVSSSVSAITPSMMTFNVTTYAYFYGAAHGMNTRNYVNYSIPLNRVITTENLFNPGTSDEVIAAINRSIRNDFNDGQLLVDSVTAYSNIRVTDSDIYFIYQPYDIAPYARGVVEIPVGIYELSDILSPIGRKALGFPGEQ